MLARLLLVTLGVSGIARPLAAQPGSLTVPLSDDEREILERGPISPGERAGGVALGLLVGFGSGQAVQGRYRNRGVMFTLVDSALVAAGLVTFDRCRQYDDASGQDGYDPQWCNAFVGALIALGAMHVWQALDAVVVPDGHNRRLREIRMKVNGNLRYQPTPTGWRSFAVPSGDGRGAIAGAQLSF